MIQVTRFNQQLFYLNPLLIETVEATPDTMITLVNGKKLLVKDQVCEILERMEQFFQSMHPYSLPSQITAHTLQEGEDNTR